MKLSLDLFITDQGNSVVEISKTKTVMVVFLRHFGCVFCREALIEIGKSRSNWEERNIHLVLVYPSDKASGEKYFSQFDLNQIDSISDPETKWYELFGLVKGSFTQLFGLKTIIRGFEVAANGTYPMLKQVGDGFQMPGIFLIRNGQIRDKYIHKSAGDKPDYESLLDCCAA